MLAVYENGDLVERYVWGPLGLVKIVKGLNGSTTDYYVLNDHLGYVRVVVDDSGDAVAGYDYFPYGKGMTGRFDNDSIYGSRFKFGAKEFDTDLDLDLYYFEARFYNPEIGRFVSPDPLRVDWSHYTFANNNPLRFIDPTGEDPENIHPEEPEILTSEDDIGQETLDIEEIARNIAVAALWIILAIGPKKKFIEGAVYRSVGLRMLLRKILGRTGELSTGQLIGTTAGASTSHILSSFQLSTMIVDRAIEILNELLDTILPD